MQPFLESQVGHFEDVDSVKKTMEVIGEDLQGLEETKDGILKCIEKKSATLCEKKKTDRIVCNANEAISTAVGIFQTAAIVFAFGFIIFLGIV